MAEIYSIELKICATAYIVAESEAEAQRLADKLADSGLEFSSRWQCVGDGVCVDGRSYECLPDNAEPVALSPAMTVHGAWTEGAKVELVEIVGEEDEDSDAATAAALRADAAALDTGMDPDLVRELHAAADKLDPQ